MGLLTLGSEVSSTVSVVTFSAIGGVTSLGMEVSVVGTLDVGNYSILRDWSGVWWCGREGCYLSMSLLLGFLKLFTGSVGLGSILPWTSLLFDSSLSSSDFLIQGLSLMPQGSQLFCKIISILWLDFGP